MMECMARKKIYKAFKTNRIKKYGDIYSFEKLAIDSDS